MNNPSGCLASPNTGLRAAYELQLQIELSLLFRRCFGHAGTMPRPTLIVTKLAFDLRSIRILSRMRLRRDARHVRRRLAKHSLTRSDRFHRLVKAW